MRVSLQGGQGGDIHEPFDWAQDLRTSLVKRELGMRSAPELGEMGTIPLPAMFSLSGLVYGLYVSPSAA